MTTQTQSPIILGASTWKTWDRKIVKVETQLFTDTETPKSVYVVCRAIGGGISIRSAGWDVVKDALGWCRSKDNGPLAQDVNAAFAHNVIQARINAFYEVRNRLIDEHHAQFVVTLVPEMHHTELATFEPKEA